ncbi:MAG: GNAT family N-acetyltransferase [Nitriliruptorales bacterium]|nr:GNAT family N-acetyltransferase [Nitriliruptorales bacterium]
MSDPGIRPIDDADLADVLELNQAHVPAVGSLDRDRLARLVAQAETAVVAEDGSSLAGFVIALPPGVDYTSPNYRWFSARYQDFVYVDRVAVSAEHQRAGVGQLLYDQVEARTDAPLFCCEVNLRPRNDASLRFHERRGFEPVGEQDTDDGAKRVLLLAKELDG